MAETIFDGWYEIGRPPPGGILSVYVEDRAAWRCKCQTQKVAGHPIHTMIERDAQIEVTL